MGSQLLTALGALLIGGSMFPSFAVTENSSLLQGFTLQPGYTEIAQNLANALIEERPEVVLIDVRTPAEYRSGHISGALNIPLETLREHELLTAVPDVSTPIIVYCRSGRRSTDAGQLLVKNGYQYVMNAGGVITWQYGLTAGNEP